MAGESNTLRIGTEGVLKAAYIAAISGTSVSGSAVVVNTSGQLGVAGSSERFKEKIAEIGNGSEVLYRLQPMSFRYKPGIDAAGTPQFGLIAEQVDRVDPDLVVRDAKGQIFTVRYEAVNAMLLNEFLKEHRRVEEVRSTIAKQETTIAELSDTLARQQKVMESLRETVEVLARKIGTPLPEGTLR
jgi:uncharacterized coiled-coil protein SlyX